jgi:Uma2 family endonuclease
MTVQDRLYTADEFWELLSQPGNYNRRLALIDGEIIELPPSSTIPGIIAAEMVWFVKGFVREHDLGYVTTAEAGFRLSPNNVLAPDVGFIAKARVEKLPERFFPGPPDLAVEVVSPTDKPKAIQRKALRYIKFGVRLVWVVYPANKTIAVYRPSETVNTLPEVIDMDGVLDGGDVLPGFTLAVRDLFKAVDQ